jgi:hypothetical protein
MDTQTGSRTVSVINKLPEATQLALEHLIRTATRDGLMVAGFAFTHEPATFAAFGNCNDHADIKLFEVLCGFVRAQREKGLVDRQNVSEVV